MPQYFPIASTLNRSYPYSLYVGLLHHCQPGGFLVSHLAFMSGDLNLVPTRRVVNRLFEWSTIHTALASISDL